MRSRRISKALDIVLAVGLVVTVWRVGGWWPLAGSAAAVPLIAIGDELTLPDVDWASSDRHLVLMISSKCRTCEESAGYYRTLSRVTAEPTLALTVVTPDPLESMTPWLKNKAIEVQRVVVVRDLPALGVSEIPTVLVVDRTGRVTDIVQRKMSDPVQQQLLARLENPSTDRLYVTYRAKEVEDREFEALLKSGQQILDVRPREEVKAGRRRDVINIPADELEVRARAELSDSSPVAIDCRQYIASRCRGAAEVLKEGGFDVTVVMPQ